MLALYLTCVTPLISSASIGESLFCGRRCPDTRRRQTGETKPPSTSRTPWRTIRDSPSLTFLLYLCSLISCQEPCASQLHTQLHFVSTLSLLVVCMLILSLFVILCMSFCAYLPASFPVLTTFISIPFDTFVSISVTCLSVYTRTAHFTPSPVFLQSPTLPFIARRSTHPIISAILQFLWSIVSSVAYTPSIQHITFLFDHHHPLLHRITLVHKHHSSWIARRDERVPSIPPHS